MSGTNDRCLMTLKAIFVSSLESIWPIEQTIYKEILHCMEPRGHYPSKHKVRLPNGVYAWDNDGELSYSRCPVEDPSTHEFPCVDYYKHCVHCRTMLNGKECDLEHVAESKRVSRSSNNKSKRLV